MNEQTMLEIYRGSKSLYKTIFGNDIPFKDIFDVIVRD